MEKDLYIFKNLNINENMIKFDFIKIYEKGLNTKQRIVLSFTNNGGEYENYERLLHDIKIYTMNIHNPYEREREYNKILECVLYIASMYIENPNLDHSEFEHILSYSKHGEHETYSLKGPRYMTDFKNNIIKSHYKYSLENRIGIRIQRIYKYFFNEECKVFEKTKIKQIEKENNMELFVSKKKKDESLYLVFKKRATVFENYGKAEVKTIKLPNELKKAFEKAASIKLIDEKEISLLPNKIRLYGISGNLKLDREEAKSIILSWLPEEKHRKMLFTSFILLQIKTKLKYISIDKDIFERFKLTDTKASYEKLYDIAVLLTKIKFGKHNYDCVKNDFSLK